MAQKKQNLELIKKLDEVEDQLLQSQEYILELQRRNKTLEADAKKRSKVEEDLLQEMEALRKDLDNKKEENANLLEKLSDADLEKTKLKQKLKRKMKKLKDLMRGGSDSDKKDDDEDMFDEDERESRSEERDKSPASTTLKLPSLFKRHSFTANKRVSPLKTKEELNLPPIEQPASASKKKSRLPRWTRSHKIAPSYDC